MTSEFPRMKAASEALEVCLRYLIASAQGNRPMTSLERLRSELACEAALETLHTVGVNSGAVLANV